MRLSDARTIPNARIRNLPNPVDPSWGPGRSLYEGAKTGLMLGGIPASTAATIPELVGGTIGGTVGGTAGKGIAKMAGAGEFGQEVGGDIGGLVGGGAGGWGGRAVGKYGLKSIATSPIRLGARALEAAANQKIAPIKPITSLMTPADEAESLRVKLPGRDVGLPKKIPPAPPEPPANAAAEPSGAFGPSRSLPGQISPEVIRPPQKTATPIPPRTGLALPPAKISQQGVGDLLNEGLGGEPLRPNVPLKDQFRGVNPQPDTSLPTGHTAADSSAVKSFKYDPEAHELHVQTKNGTTYISGEVSPEQARDFVMSDSKGKAWKVIRDSSPLVAKIVNGKRVSSVPSGEFRSAGPESEAPAPKIPTGENLEPILRESLKRAKGRG